MAYTPAFYRSVLIVIVTTLLFLAVGLLVWQYSWALKNCPLMLRGIVAGSDASARMHYTSPARLFNVTIPAAIVDAKMRPDGIVVTDLPVPSAGSAVRQAVSFWVKLDNTGAGELPSTVLIQGSSVERPDLALLFDSRENAFVLRVRTMFELGSVTHEFQEFRAPNVVSRQRWTHVAVSVDTRVIDVFVDGRLVRSFTCLNVPILIDREWRIFPGTVPFPGMLSLARYFSFSLSRADVNTLYAREKSNPESPRAWWFLWRPVRARALPKLIAPSPAFAGRSS